MDGPRSVTATFTLNTHAITVNVSPAEGGSASCTPNPVPHGGDASCSATPAAGYSFAGWSGDCSGTSCELADVDGPRSVTATFTLNTHAIMVSASPVEGGSASCTPNPVSHGGDASCSATPA